MKHSIGQADLEARFGLPRPPQAVNKVKPRLTDWMAEFIRHSPFVVLGTSNAASDLDLSPKGGAPGFVAVLDERTLLVPDYAGNHLFFGHRNLFENDHVGLLFMVPGEGWTVRVNGRAQLVEDVATLSQLSQAGEKPRLALKIAVEEAFSHCPKAFTRSDLWNPAKHSRLSSPAKGDHSAIPEVW